MDKGPSYKSIIIRPEVHAIAILGWVCLLFYGSIYMGCLYVMWRYNNLAPIVAAFIFWFAVRNALVVLTIKIKLVGDALFYSSLFTKKTLRLSEIKDVFSYMTRENWSLSGSSFNSKIMYVIAPADRKPKTIQIDGSWFSPESRRALEAFFCDRIGAPLSYDEGGLEYFEFGGTNNPT